MRSAYSDQQLRNDIDEAARRIYGYGKFAWKTVKNAMNYGNEWRMGQKRRHTWSVPVPSKKPRGGPGPRKLPKKPSRMPSKRYGAVGHKMVGRGVYKKYFKRGPRRGPDVYAKKGVMTYREDAGVVEQDKTVYIGHYTSPAEGVFQIVFEAILRKLAKKSGIDFKSTRDIVGKQYGSAAGSEGEVFYATRVIEGGTLNRQAIAITADMTWQALAAALVTQLKGLITSGIQRLYVEYIEICFNTDAAVPTFNHPSARIYCNNLRVCIKSTSEMAIQNRTLANTGGTGDEHHSVLNVENNPLQGYSYYCPGNGLRYKYSYDAGGRVTLLADDTKGQIELDPDDAGLPANYQSLLSRPPMAHMFQGVKGRVKQMLGPGVIKKDYLKTYANTTLNSLLQKYKQWLVNQSEHQIWFGKSRVFAFEKMMHTNEASEPFMSVGWEINHHMFCYVKETPLCTVMEKDV